MEINGAERPSIVVVRKLIVIENIVAEILVLQLLLMIVEIVGVRMLRL